MDEPKLKPCPFCGAQLEQTTYGVWEHPDGECFLAHADTEFENIVVFPDDIDRWNRRVKDA